jgi:hypothetical protein
MALDLRGTQDPRQSFRNCFQTNTYPLLAQGRLYACTVAPNVRHFNRRFGTGMRLEEGDWLDIHRPVTAAGILEFLSEPRPFCRHCRVSRRSYGHPWRRSSGDFHEWGAAVSAVFIANLEGNGCQAYTIDFYSNHKLMPVNRAGTAPVFSGPDTHVF